MNDPEAPGTLPWIDDVLHVLTCLCLCQDSETSIAAIDSALNKGALVERQLPELSRRLPKRLSWLISAVDGKSESGVESIVRTRLASMGIRARLQVPVPGLGRVDLMVGSVIIEVDGREFHANRFEEDRRRDAVAAASGHRVLRFSYAQVMHRWHEVEAAILGAIRQPYVLPFAGRHR